MLTQITSIKALKIICKHDIYNIFSFFQSLQIILILRNLIFGLKYDYNFLTKEIKRLSSNEFIVRD